MDEDEDVVDELLEDILVEVELDVLLLAEVEDELIL